MRPPSAPTSASEQLATALAPVLGPVEITDLQRLSGGASRETWSFRAGGRPLILRRDPPGRPGLPGSMKLEADAMRACHQRGLRVPEIVLDDDGAHLGTAGLVMSAVPGETLARRILRDDEFARARDVLVDQLGTFLAGSARDRSGGGARRSRGRRAGALLDVVRRGARSQPDLREGLRVARGQPSAARGDDAGARRPAHGERHRRRRRPRRRHRLGAGARR